jgi:hypothetical protein
MPHRTDRRGWTPRAHSLVSTTARADATQKTTPDVE